MEYEPFNSRHSMQGGGEIPDFVVDTDKYRAQLLTALHGNDPLICVRGAVEALTKRNRELKNPEGIEDALASQVAIVEAIAIRMTAEALKAKKPECRKNLMSVALRAQQTMTGILATLYKIQQEKYVRA